MSQFADFGNPVYDTFDLDLLVKVLAHTAFSEYIASYSRMVADWKYARPFLHVLYPRILLLPGRALAGARSGHSRRLQSRALCLLYVNQLRERDSC